MCLSIDCRTVPEPAPSTTVDAEPTDCTEQVADYEEARREAASSLRAVQRTLAPALARARQCECNADLVQTFDVVEAELADVIDQMIAEVPMSKATFCCDECGHTTNMGTGATTWECKGCAKGECSASETKKTEFECNGNSTFSDGRVYCK